MRERERTVCGDPAQNFLPLPPFCAPAKPPCWPGALPVLEPLMAPTEGDAAAADAADALSETVNCGNALISTVRRLRRP